MTVCQQQRKEAASGAITSNCHNTTHTATAGKDNGQQAGRQAQNKEGQGQRQQGQRTHSNRQQRMNQ